MEGVQVVFVHFALELGRANGSTSENVNSTDAPEKYRMRRLGD